MDKATLKDKQNWISDMTRLIWQTNTISPQEKQLLDKELTTVVGKNVTKIELEQKKQEIFVKLKIQKQEIVNRVANNLKSPQNLTNVSDIKNINTLNREGGQVITSVQTKDGTYVKDSSYSGNIDEVVKEVAKKNQDKQMNNTALTNEAFKEMQQRQIPINMQDVNKAGLNDKQISNLKQIPNVGDNLKINRDYQIMVDENNNLVDLRNQNNEASNYESENQQDKSMLMEEKPKVKMYKKNGAFVDAALLGTITFYTGILGLCLIFSKM